MLKHDTRCQVSVHTIEFPNQSRTCFMKMAAAMALLMALSNSTSGYAQTASDPLAALSFLLGSWRSNSASGGAETFKTDLAGHVILRASRSAVVGENGKVAGSMQSLLTIYVDGAARLQALYLDDAGHVIHYDMSTLTAGHHVEFVSTKARGVPSFRLTYDRAANGALDVRFAMATPSHPTEFRTVAEGSEVPVP